VSLQEEDTEGLRERKKWFFVELHMYKEDFGNPSKHGAKVVWHKPKGCEKELEGVWVAKRKKGYYEYEEYNDKTTKKIKTLDDGEDTFHKGQVQERFDKIAQANAKEADERAKSAGKSSMDHLVAISLKAMRTALPAHEDDRLGSGDDFGSESEEDDDSGEDARSEDDSEEEPAPRHQVRPRATNTSTGHPARGSSSNARVEEGREIVILDGRTKKAQANLDEEFNAIRPLLSEVLTITETLGRNKGPEALKVFKNQLAERLQRTVSISGKYRAILTKISRIKKQDAFKDAKDEAEAGVNTMKLLGDLLKLAMQDDVGEKFLRAMTTCKQEGIHVTSAFKVMAARALVNVEFHYTRFDTMFALFSSSGDLVFTLQEAGLDESEIDEFAATCIEDLASQLVRTSKVRGQNVAKGGEQDTLLPVSQFLSSLQKHCSQPDFLLKQFAWQVVCSEKMTKKVSK